ncbi:T9SS type A sorting domain-containing protein [uncultured Lutibacter sp.]|uniref:T9SS type A sorting domain-containing protein n=1 Tax=uncultured Lutibacter sp. TaxID=437739 RepID=UPI00261A74E3|nr:T9SS type A sorting domain-containing protein [uncultured Lutibacter sp.]
MKKNVFILSVLCFFLNIAFINAQKALTASTAQGTATTTGNGVNWTPVVVTSLNLTAGTKVLVKAVIEATVTSGNSDINTEFRLTDGTNFSPVIFRYVTTKTYTDKGKVSISFIFDSTPFTGSKTFTLEHTKTTSGENKQFTSKAIITAIEISNSNIILPSGQATASLTSTTSTTYSPVATTNMITLEKTADIYITSTFSTSTTDVSASGDWSIQESTDNISYTDIPNSQITRSITAANDAGIGAATIATLIKAKPAGNYYFRLADKVNTGTNLSTIGATISAVVLRSTIATGDDVFPSYTQSPPSETSTTNTYSVINSATITAPENGFTDNKFFMHTTYNMTAAGDNIAYATHEFTSSAGTFTPFEIQRYVLNGTTGSGGLIGIVSGINALSSFDVSFQHKNSGATGTLTTSNINTIGFFLNSDPFSTLSVEEDILNSNISIYPNPSKEQCYISNNVTEGETSFKFYTLTGQLVHSLTVKPKEHTKVDITGWASGVYILKATNNGINIAKKLIIK